MRARGKVAAAHHGQSERASDKEEEGEFEKKRQREREKESNPGRGRTLPPPPPPPPVLLTTRAWSTDLVSRLPKESKRYLLRFLRSSVRPRLSDSILTLARQLTEGGT